MRVHGAHCGALGSAQITSSIIPVGQRKRKTRRWLQEHRGDEYVRRAGKLGYRSRAAFKLEQMDRRDRLFRPGQVVVELGAAPGGWTQYIAQRLGGKGAIFALDLIAMDPLPGVRHLCGDFTDPATRRALAGALGGRGVDLVISDMAPKITGVAVTDQARAAELGAAVLEFASQVLVPGGRLLLKMFAGEEAHHLERLCAASFAQSVVRKPDASRSRSREIYLLNSGFGRR